MTSKPVSSGKSLRVSGKQLGLKVHSTYLLQEDPESSYLISLTLDRPSKIPRHSLRVEQRRRKVDNPLYQTVVLAEPRVLNKCQWISERRSRYLTHKYGKFWLAKLYGRRVTPSAARGHRDLCMLRKAMCTWKGVWWLKKKEWRLVIRADCHYRYCVWLKCWRGWQKYVAEKKLQKLQKLNAIGYARKCRLKCCFKRWKISLLKQEEKKLKIVELYQLSLIKRFFNGWKCYCSLVECRLRMNEKASHHNCYSVSTKVMREWRTRLKELKLSHGKNNAARRHFRITLLSKVIVSWRMLAKQHVKFQQMKECGQMYRDEVLLHRVYDKWVGLTRDKRCSQKHYSSLLCGRCLCAWVKSLSTVVKHRQLKASLMLKAILHTEKVLKFKVFKRLSKFVTQQKKIRQMSSVAKNHSVLLIQKRVLGVWLKRCEHCEDIKLRPLMIKANKCFRRVIVTKCFSSWRLFVDWKVRKLKLSDKVTFYRKQRLLPKCWKGLRLNVEINRKQQLLSKRSQEFRRSVLMSVVFYRWWNRHVCSLEEQLANSVALDYYCHSLMRQNFIFWKNKKSVIQSHVLLQIQADAIDGSRITRAFFNLWHKRLMESRTRTKEEVSASEWHGKRIATICLKSWRGFVAHKQKQEAICCLHYSNKLTIQCFCAWKVYKQRSCKAQRKVDLAISHYSSSVCRRVLCCWKNHVAVIVKFKRMLLDSLYFSRHRTLRKIFVMWREVTVSLLTKEKEELNHIMSVRAVLDKRVTRSLFCKWQLQVKCVCKEKHDLDKSLLHRDRTLLLKVFKSWFQYHSCKINDKDLLSRAVLFDNLRCVSSVYGLWRIRTVELQTLKLTTSVALWKWSSTLQLNCFKSWRVFVMDRRRKKRRYSQAMDYHRTVLLKEGVTHWIKTACALQGVRSEQSFDLFVEDFSLLLSRVRRCAIYWRNKTKKSRIIRSHDSGPHGNRSRDSGSHGSTSHDSGPHGSNLQYDTHWNKIIESIDHELPRLSRPPPRRPDFLFSDCCVPVAYNSTSIVEGVPHQLLTPTADMPPDIPCSCSFSSVTTVNDPSLIANCIVKPNDWKLLPPSVFKKTLN